MAKSTLQTRNSQWTKYLTFMCEHGLQSLPASSTDICRFIAYIARSSKYSTVNNYLSAVIVLHRMYGYEVKFREDYAVKLVLQGIRRVLGDLHSPLPSLQPRDLISAFVQVDLSSSVQHAVWSSVCVAFRSLLRKSNILVCSESDHVLSRRDVVFTDWGMVLIVSSTKTIQHGERELSIPVVRSPGSPLCAVTYVWEHIHRVPASPDSPLFMTPGDRGAIPLTYSTALRWLKCWCNHLLRDTTGLGFHSLRRGAASYLHGMGVSLQDIMQAGDWKSLAVLSYLVRPLEQKLSVERKVAASLSLR